MLTLTRSAKIGDSICGCTVPPSCGMTTLVFQRKTGQFVPMWAAAGAGRHEADSEDDEDDCDIDSSRAGSAQDTRERSVASAPVPVAGAPPSEATTATAACQDIVPICIVSERCAGT